MGDRGDRHHGGDGPRRPASHLRLVDDTGVASERRALRVLYVEDDEADVYLLKRQMRDLANYAVDFLDVPSIREAEAVLAEQRFDVILCDFWLGSETTIRLIDSIGADPRPTPIVLVSSLESEDLELIGRRAGTAGFVSKQDLTAAALDRIFTTLLKEPSGSAECGETLRVWFRGLLHGLDRAKSLSGTDRLVVEDEAYGDVFAHSAEIRHEVVEKLVGLDRFDRPPVLAPPTRFDAMAYVIDAVADLRRRAGTGAAVRFLPPLMAVEVEGNHAFFADLVQGFFAEAADLIDAGSIVAVTPRLIAGRLTVDIHRVDAGAPSAPEDPHRAAAAAARRLVVVTLGGAAGGRVLYEDPEGDPALVARLVVPLRARA